MPRHSDAPLAEGKFRLFKINLDNKDLELSVKSFTLWRAPQYEAISYAWGNRSDGTTIITCDGKPFEVWQNLHSVLRRLHREGNSSWLWIDAICIEQEGELGRLEKVRQIPFMETIFPAAEPVRVWLGEASVEEERALLDLVAICSKPREGRGLFENITTLPDKDDDIWTSWVQILLRPWFTRVWTVQEVLLTREVVLALGSRTLISWNEFRTVVEMTSIVSSQIELKYDCLDDRAKETIRQDFKTEHHVSLTSEFDLNKIALQMFSRNRINISEMLFLERFSDRILEDGFFQQILAVYGNRKCAYNQDRPNAMRGVLPKKLRRKLKVYNVDTDLATVYREVSRHWLENDPTLSLLHRVRPKIKFLAEKDHALASKYYNPSWTIDLGQVLGVSLVDQSFSVKDGFHSGLIRDGKNNEWAVPPALVCLKPFLRSKSRFSAHFCDPRTDWRFEVAGIRIDVIASVFQAATTMQNDLANPLATPQHFRKYKFWLESTLMITREAIENEREAVEIHWRTIVRNHAETKDPAVTTVIDVNNKFSRYDAYKAVMDIFASEDYDKAKEMLANASYETQNYLRDVQITHASFPIWFYTSYPLKLFGCCYSIPQPGDIVAVFYGAATPFLLRPTTNDWPPPKVIEYEFIGEAYVHGIMQGEAFLPANKHLYEKTTFVLV